MKRRIAPDEQAIERNLYATAADGPGTLGFRIAFAGWAGSRCRNAAWVAEKFELSRRRDNLGSPLSASALPSPCHL
jgi:hypothetical protein